LLEPTAPRTMILIDPDLDREPPPISDAASQSALSIPVRRRLARFLAKAQSAVQLRGQVTILLTTDTTMRDLNRRFRGQDKPTDVLSFPADTLVQDKEKGDLAISVDAARRQASDQGHSLTAELEILLLHGLLHLAGYDHESDEGRMDHRERLLRQRLGLPVGLIERAKSKPASERASKPARGRKP
jgi:probable rRNA maturation factor